MLGFSTSGGSVPMFIAKIKIYVFEKECVFGHNTSATETVFIRSLIFRLKRWWGALMLLLNHTSHPGSQPPLTRSLGFRIRAVPLGTIPFQQSPWRTISSIVLVIWIKENASLIVDLIDIFSAPEWKMIVDFVEIHIYTGKTAINDSVKEYEFSGKKPKPSLNSPVKEIHLKLRENLNTTVWKIGKRLIR